MRIKLYDKNFSPLTTLINSSSTSDFNNLNYKNQVNGVGDASFDVRIDNAKITSANIKHYNHVDITDDDGTVRWTGVIVEKQINLNMIGIKCYGLAHVLDRRLTGDAEVHNGQANTEIANILNIVNATEDTGITAGIIQPTNAVNLTFNRGKVLQSIKSIADTSSSQYIVKQDRKLYVQTIVGQDLTASVIFRYENSNPELANVLQFNIDDDGKVIVSKSYGKSDTLSSTQEDSTIRTAYGLLEDFQSLTNAKDQPTLDKLTINNNQDSGLSPTVTLSPTVGDNFDAGDIVRVILNNGFIGLDTEYQVLEKSVKIVNNQKMITIRLNLEKKDFLADFKDMRASLELLTRSI